MSRQKTPLRQARPVWRIEPARCLMLAGGRAVVLRPVSPADAALMAEFFASLTPREIFYFFALDETAARRLAIDAEWDPAFRLIAVGNDAGCERVLGYMFLDWREGEPPTYGACLREGAQSSGLGRAMIDHLLTSAAASGLGPVQLTVHADNWRALRLYQRAGFRLYNEFILQPQGAKQYRMEADLRTPRPRILEDLTLVARGGLGVGLAAAAIQRALEAALGQRPLLLDRPVRTCGRVIIVADLVAPPDRPFDIPLPPMMHERHGPGWIVSLDENHLLVGGIGAAAVDRTAHIYADLLMRNAGAWTELAESLQRIPFAGIHRMC